MARLNVRIKPSIAYIIVTMVTGSLPMPISGEMQVEPDFVFTHSELEDVLSFMTGGVEEKPSSFGTNNFLLGSTPPASASLQFQPHLSNPYDSLGLDQGLNGAQPFLTQIGSDPLMPQDAGMQFDMSDHLQSGLNPQASSSKALRGVQPMIKPESLGDMDAPGIRSPLDMSSAPSPVHASSAAMDDVSGRTPSIRTRHGAQGAGGSETAPLTKAFAQLGSGLSSPLAKPRQSSAELPTSYHRKGACCFSTLDTMQPTSSSQYQRIFFCHVAGSKQHTSHSTVEKNRRDRINSLIDEVSARGPPNKAPGTTHDCFARDWALWRTSVCKSLPHQSHLADLQIARFMLNSFGSCSCGIWCHPSQRTAAHRTTSIQANAPSMSSYQIPSSLCGSSSTR